MRQFTDSGYTGTKISYDPQEFEDKVRQEQTSVGNIQSFAYFNSCFVRAAPVSCRVCLRYDEAKVKGAWLIRSSWEEQRGL